jgi:O-antigen ligase
LITLLYVSHRGYTCFVLLKLILIFSTYCIINNNIDEYWRILFWVLVISAIVNVIGLFIIYPVILKAPHTLFHQPRHDSVINVFGILERGGSLLYPFALSGLLFFKRPLLSLLCLVMSLFIIIADGSRTALIYIFLVSLLIIAYALYYAPNKKHRLLLIALSITGIVTVTIFAYQQLHQHSEIRLFQSIQDIASGKIKSVDPARDKMFQYAVNKVLHSPLLGTGIGTTRVNVGSLGTMPVHNAYLEIWGDAGIVGLVGLMIMLLSWLYYLPKVLAKLRNASTNRKINLIGSIAIFVYCIVDSMFNPFTDEWYIWFFYVMASCYYWRFVFD